MVVSGTLRSGRYDLLTSRPPYGGRDVKESYLAPYDVVDTIPLHRGDHMVVMRYHWQSEINLELETV